MMNHHSTRHWTELKRKAMHRLVPAFFLCSVLAANAADNWADGIAYGTTNSDIATATSISSQTNGMGSLVIGHTNTTHLTLGHNITGFVAINNHVNDFTITASGTNTSHNSAAFYAENATNLTITGGHFFGTEGSGGSFPPIPGQPQPTNSTVTAMGGLLFNSEVVIDGTEFAGINDTEGLLINQTTLVVSNGTFRGGSTGAGLVAENNSTVTIHTGSFTGGGGNTAFYLQDSDVTVYGGTFAGNIGGTNNIAGDGLFSELTGATTNHVNLHGGTFSSLAFYGEEGSVQHFLAGTNLIVNNGIIQNGGTVIVDNQNDSALKNIMIVKGTMDFTTDDFSLVDGGELGFGIIPGTQGFLTADKVYFHTNSTLLVDARAAGFTAGTTNVTLVSTTSGLFMIGTTTNMATGADFSTNNVTTFVSGRNTLKDILVDGNQSLRFQFTTETLRNYWNADGQFGDLADELDTINNSTMNAIINSIDDPDISGPAVERTYFTTPNTFQTTLMGLNAAVGQSVSRGTDFREGLRLPAGAKGPNKNNDLRGWAKYYGQFFSHDAEDLNSSYDSTLHGGMIGVDHSFGSLLIGLSGGAGRYSTELNSDATEDINAYQGALYSTFGTARGYIDGGIAYGFNQVETRTASPFILNGEFDAQLLSAYLGGGYALVDTKGGTVFTPEASIQYSMYEQDAYSETSTTAVPRNMDAFDADSLRSSLGLNISMLNNHTMETVDFIFEGRFHWLHEFNPEPGNMNFSLEGGDNDYQLAHPMLDEDLFRAGFGFTFFNTTRHGPKNVLLRLDFDELFGDGFNSHNLSAKLVYAF